LNNGKQTESITLARRKLYKDGNWNTLCLPFDVTISGSPPLLRVIVLRNDAQLLQSSLHTINGGLFDYEGADVIYEGGAR
jgi:hypothetical protein